MYWSLFINHYGESGDNGSYRLSEDRSYKTHLIVNSSLLKRLLSSLTKGLIPLTHGPAYE